MKIQKLPPVILKETETEKFVRYVEIGFLYRKVETKWEKKEKKN